MTTKLALASYCLFSTFGLAVFLAVAVTAAFIQRSRHI